MSPRSSIAWSSTGPWKAKASVTSPPSPFSSTVASSWPRKQTLPSSPKRTTSPGARRLAGFTKARQREPSRRRCSVASMAGSAPRPMRRPFSRAGITLVSLTTRTSPARSSSGRSRTERSSSSGRRTGPHDQQARRVARNDRSQRNPVWREVEIEQVGAHQRPSSPTTVGDDKSRGVLRGRPEACAQSRGGYRSCPKVQADWASPFSSTSSTWVSSPCSPSLFAASTANSRASRSLLYGP